MATPSPSKRSTLIEATLASPTPSVLSCADGMSPRGVWRVPHQLQDGEIAGFENVAKYGLELDQPGEIGAWRGLPTVVSARSAVEFVVEVAHPAISRPAPSVRRKDGGEHQAHRATRSVGASCRRQPSKSARG